MYDKGMNLDQYIKKHQSNLEKSSDFSAYLFELIDKHGFAKDSDVYNKANISRQSWSLIISGKVKPSLNTLIKIVFALHLDNHECKYLLKKAGFTLSSSSEFSLIIRYFIENKKYNIYELNETLARYGYEEIE